MPPSTNPKTENSNPILVDRIVERLQAQPQQRVSFVQYMDWVLYEPQYGYYAANRAKIGAAGDFFTAPHVSHDFGELLAEQFQEMWQRMFDAINIIWMSSLQTQKFEKQISA